MLRLHFNTMFDFSALTMKLTSPYVTQLSATPIVWQFEQTRISEEVLEYGIIVWQLPQLWLTFQESRSIDTITPDNFLWMFKSSSWKVKTFTYGCCFLSFQESYLGILWYSHISEFVSFVFINTSIIIVFQRDVYLVTAIRYDAFGKDKFTIRGTFGYGRVQSNYFPCNIYNIINLTSIVNGCNWDEFLLRFVKIKWLIGLRYFSVIW